jgi:alkylation response protein AidB-like acyl-CoA dehydrogenase
MDFALPADDDPRRVELRSWLAMHPEPDHGTLATAGLVAPQWPRPWGLGADPEHQLIVQQELRRAGIAGPENQIGIGWAGPTLLAGGTQEQQQRWLPPLLEGSEIWCQLFSEPDAGSDLAALRTRADRDGDHYVINGQKIWSTWADHARWGILLARTDQDAPKHRGISYFVLDMEAPGVEVRPIREMTGQAHFNETFLTEVHVPVDHRIGGEGDGWRLALVTLGNERVSLSEGGVLWGMGPESPELFDLIRGQGPLDEPLLRQRAAQLYAETTILQLLGHRVLTAMLRGRDPGPEASIRKTLADVHGQRVMALAKDLQEASGMLGVQSPDAQAVDVWHWGYLFSRALTIGGGTSEVQRGIIGERLLGLPKEPA